MTQNGWNSDNMETSKPGAGNGFRGCDGYGYGGDDGFYSGSGDGSGSGTSTGSGYSYNYDYGCGKEDCSGGIIW